MCPSVEKCPSFRTAVVNAVLQFTCVYDIPHVCVCVYFFSWSQTRQRSESSSSANSDGDFAEQGRSSPPEPSQDTDLRRGAPPSYFDAVRLGTAVPVAITDPPQYTADEQLGDPESSLPSYPVSTSHLSPPLSANTELSPPQMSNSEASASYPQEASNTGEVHANSEVASAHPIPAGNTDMVSSFFVLASFFL